MSKKWVIEKVESDDITESELDVIFRTSNARNQESEELYGLMREMGPGDKIRLRVENSAGMTNEQIVHYLNNLRATIGKIAKELNWPFMTSGGGKSRRRAYQTAVYEKDGYPWLWVRLLSSVGTEKEKENKDEKVVEAA